MIQTRLSHTTDSERYENHVCTQLHLASKTHNSSSWLHICTLHTWGLLLYFDISMAFYLKKSIESDINTINGPDKLYWFIFMFIWMCLVLATALINSYLTLLTVTIIGTFATSISRVLYWSSETSMSTSLESPLIIRFGIL